jgi:hypothetical protein
MFVYSLLVIIMTIVFAYVFAPDFIRTLASGFIHLLNQRGFGDFLIGLAFFIGFFYTGEAPNDFRKFLEDRKGKVEKKTTTAILIHFPCFIYATILLLFGCASLCFFIGNYFGYLHSYSICR